MPSDKNWNKVWQKRGKAYHEANTRWPEARREERARLIAGLSLEGGLTLLDVAAGGGYLTAGVRAAFGERIRFLAIEPSDTFARQLPDYTERIEAGSIIRFGLPGASVDRVSNLSGLHHTPDNSLFFAEAARVLKPGGILGAADVRKGSAVDRWLNDFVHRHASEGHRGGFFDEGEFRRKMKSAGFRNIEEETAPLGWYFSSREEMAAFCGILFGLDRASPDEILSGIGDILGFRKDSTGIRMNWELIYAFGKKLP